MPSSTTFRVATPQDNAVIARHFYQLWVDNAVTPDRIKPDWETIVLAFLKQARQDLQYQAFVAEVAGEIVGSAGCQRFAGLYPLVLADSHRSYGYIWGVYVEPPYRGQGIATTLTTMTIDYLKTIGCTRAILHASPSGKPVYTSLGFTTTNEMGLDLHQ